ncbi:Dual function macrocyclase-peptidase POPB [Labeo rohita]|uniref:Dual function macrocyclase-peptidase POPB n=1 Tax=Labeo rohita TaxID=84645 RepID=A0ABQ8LT72_LABRO|nr:Dual function macrocyclase-peptidase POPB [Labeo rohita]
MDLVSHSQTFGLTGTLAAFNDPPKSPYERNVKEHDTPVSQKSCIFNQSDDDFETPDAFPLLCAVCIRRSVNGLWALRGLRAVWVLQDEKERNMAREKETRRERPLQSYSNHMQMRLRTPHEKWIINHLAPLGQSEGKALITPSSKRGGEQAPRCDHQPHLDPAVFVELSRHNLDPAVQIMCLHQEPRHVSADLLESRHVTAGHPEYCHVLSVAPRSLRSILHSAESPEVAAFTAEPPEMGVPTYECSVCSVMAMEDVGEHSVCPFMAKEAFSELSVCPATANKTDPELSDYPVMSKEANYELLSCPNPATEVVCEVYECPVKVKETFYELSDCRLQRLFLNFCPALNWLRRLIVNCLSNNKPDPVNTIDAIHESSAMSVTTKETNAELCEFLTSVLEAIHALSVLHVSDPLEPSAPPWGSFAPSAPPWKSFVLLWWSSALLWRSSALLWWSSAPPWRSSSPSYLLWCSSAPPVPPWWFLASPVLAWWSSVPPAPAWWLPAPPVSLWFSAPPALPQFFVPPLGPGPPSLPLFRLHSTSLPEFSLFCLEHLEAAPWWGALSQSLAEVPGSFARGHSIKNVISHNPLPGLINTHQPQPPVSHHLINHTL